MTHHLNGRITDGQNQVIVRMWSTHNSHYCQFGNKFLPFYPPPLSRSFLPSFYLPSSLPFFSFLFQSLSMWFISWWVLEAGATMVRFWWEFSSWLAHSHFKAVFSHRREKRDKGRRDERRRKEGTSSLPIFKKNLNIHLPYNPSILLLGTYLREVKTHVLTKMYARSLELLYL